MANEQHPQPTSVDESTQQRTPFSFSSQYVYPVRSLLSGRIHPAADEPIQEPPSQSHHPSTLDSSSNSPALGTSQPIVEEVASGKGDSHHVRGGVNKRCSVTLGSDASSTTPIQASQSSRPDALPQHRTKKADHTLKRSKDFGPFSANSKSLSPGNDHNLPTTNSSKTSTPAAHSQPFAAEPTPELVPVSVLTSNEEMDDIDYKHLAQVSELSVDAFTTTPTAAKVAPTPPRLALPFNPSEYGIVHLPPRPSRMPSTDGLSQSSGRKSTSSRYSTAQSSRQSSKRNEQISRLDTQSSSPYSHSLSGFDPQALSAGYPSTSLLSSRSDVDNVNAEPLMTMRYKHQEDENGNHLVIGREGQLMRCEDEPIRTPGAVQGFGVLIAVDEDMNTGNLSVRQVSENSTELLGLSPKYLFSLECFTETLPDSQAAILCDNIQYLQEPDPQQEDDSPHVFILTGWSEKGREIPGEPSDNGRRTWTCWCALHRPQSVSGTESNLGGAPNTIILEFEPERDTHNPLYPISCDTPDLNSPASNNSGSSGERSSTGSSDLTLVGQDDLSTPAVLDTTVGGVNHPPEQERSQLPPVPMAPVVPSSLADLEGEEDWVPSAEDILESTTSRSKPIPALERLRRISKGVPASTPAPTSGGVRTRRAAARTNTGGFGGVGIMDVFAVMTQINEQLGAAPDLDSFLKIVVGVIKDLSQFHRVLVYQFDEVWNGQVVAELVDWRHSHDLFKGLHFPASDIPAQARDLYAINKVRLLYDRSQQTARIVVRSKAELESPLNMTHCYLRAMSPIHIKYLANMGVRASMSVSIMAFGALWGLITCHSYGTHRMRVSFPVRQMLRLLSQSISRNIERLSYAQRLHTRRVINTMASDNHPTGHIVSNADDLLGLFDADYGILVIGEGAKILGPNLHGQEILVMAEYLRLKQFETIKVSQAVIKDFPDLELSTGLEVIAGLLYVPLSSGGQDFIAFLRKGQLRDIHWAGRPQKQGVGAQAGLEPRKSFKIWSEVVAGRCRAWTDEQMETAGVLSLVYGKFIEVWRQKETALQTTKLTNILLSNASHEVRTPLHHIINYLEMALDGPLDLETRENLNMSHAASKSLLFTINDLLDLTRLESGKQISLNEAFDLQAAIEEATRVYRNEAARRNLKFKLDVSQSPKMVVGDPKKIMTVVANLTANALKYTTDGSITVHSRPFGEPEGLRAPTQKAVEIIVADTGFGISSDKLECIFREFEQVESSEPRTGAAAGLGLGLAVVARIVEQLGGQLRVDSQIGQGSQFSFLIPLTLETEMSSDSDTLPDSPLVHVPSNLHQRSHHNSGGFRDTDINSLVEAHSSNHTGDPSSGENASSIKKSRRLSTQTGKVKVDPFAMDGSVKRRSPTDLSASLVSSNASPPIAQPPSTADGASRSSEYAKLRVLIVEDNDINRRILGKRLTLFGHTIVNATNGQEGLDKVKEDQEFDVILMDIQMPILNGYEATEGIRKVERATFSLPRPSLPRRLSHELNGRIPIFAVSASLIENQRAELCELGMDGWILKPIDFKRLDIILKGVTDSSQREQDTYRPGCSWEIGGWLTKLSDRPAA